MKKKIIITALALAAIVVTIALVPDRWDKLLVAARWAESAPHLAWPLFLITFFVAIVLMFPGWVLMVIGGYLFGTVTGTLLSFVANLAGSTAAFFVAKTFARHRIEATFSQSEWFRQFDAAVARNGFTANLFARLALLPYALLNYACGLTGMRLKDFVSGTALGTLPILAANVLIGAGTEDLFTTMAEEGLQPQSLPYEIPIVLITVLALSFILAKRFRRRLPPGAPDTELKGDEPNPDP